MDSEKLIEQLRSYTYWLGQDGPESHDIHPLICDDAATALSTLQAENARLREEVESLKKGYCAGCSIPAVKAEQIRDLTDAPKLRAELEQVKMECDAAKSTLAERIGVRGAEPITTAFGLPIDRLRELAKADREGRCVALPCKVGDTVYQVDDIRVYALEVRNLIYDAGILAFDESTIGKTVFLTREEAQAALRREQDG